MFRNLAAVLLLVLAGCVAGASQPSARVVCASNAGTVGHCDYVTDGVDDQAQIQNALLVGNSVKLTDGPFYISATITVPSGTELWLDGGATLVLAPGANTDLLNVSNTDYTRIHGGTLDGNRAANTAGRGIVGSGARYLRVSDMNFREFAGNGIELSYGQESEGVSLTRLAMSQMAATGIWLDGLKDSTVADFHFESEEGSHGIYARSLLSSSISRTHITAVGDGIRLDWRSRHNVLSQINADNGNGYGVAFVDNIPASNNEAANILTGGAFYNNKKSGVLVLRSQYVVVAGTSSTKNGRNGTYTAHGIEVVDSKFVQASLNILVDTQATPTQSYGIHESGTSDWNDFRFNRAYPNKDGAIWTVGPNTVQ